MRILVTGGNGSVGRDLVPALLARDHHVVALDRDLSALRVDHPRLERVRGGLEDRALLAGALRGVDAVVHLAWSFAEDPRELLERDLLPHQVLLELCRAEKVGHLVYASTAVVYGKPRRVPIDEDHPLLVLEARKPSYGVAKEFAEKLSLLASRAGGPAATVLRFWWAFGEEIGGRHLREMLRAAAAGTPVAVPADCGGSFVSMEDLSAAVAAALGDPRSHGQVFNVSSAYVTWQEVAGMAVEVTGSRAGVQVVPRAEWTGAAFLADAWRLDDGRIRDRLGFAPRREPQEVRRLLRESIGRTWRSLAAAAAEGKR